MDFRFLLLLFLGRWKLPEGINPSGEEQELDFPFARKFLKSASRQLSAQGFLLFSPFAERHGSWDITFHRASGDIDHTISIDFTSEFAPGVEGHISSWRVEIWIGAEQNQQFMRRMVRQLTANLEELDSKALLNELEKILKQSIRLLSGLKAEDLTTRYPKRRHEPGERRISALWTEEPNC